MLLVFIVIKGAILELSRAFVLVFLLCFFSVSFATSVNGYLCSSFPDVNVVSSGSYFHFVCPSSLRGGCAFLPYTFGGSYGHYELSPGQSSDSLSLAYGKIKGYEVYFCDIASCSCSDWVNSGSCGGSCSVDKMLVTRSCVNDCDIESACAYRDCSVASFCGDGRCSNGENCGSCARDCGSCCASNAYYSCSGGSVYWFDSCGNIRSLKEYCPGGCLGSACVVSYPKTITRSPYSFTAYNSDEERLLLDFLGINPSGDAIDVFLSGLSNDALLSWESYWVHAWVGVRRDDLVSFTQGKRAEYFDVCNVVCPSGWSCRLNSCYSVLSERSWHQASSDCGMLGAHLLTVDDAGENDFTHGLVGDFAWIGFNDLAVDSYWSFTNGFSSFVNWNPNEPNGGGRENCGQFWYGAGWNDGDCNGGYKAVCELDGVPVNPVCSNACTTGCPVGWSCRGGSCYRLTSGSWFQSKSSCESLGAHLVTVSDVCENEWAYVNSHSTAWIGFNDLVVEGAWSWLSGVGITHWTPGEPNDASASEDCAQFWSSPSWNDGWCGNVNQALCELEHPCPLSCSDGNACTFDYCSVTGCSHDLVSNCVGNGVCESGESFCNAPLDCKAPVCGVCESVSCVSGSPICVKSLNCCGNGVCEAGESCSSCERDCNCVLGVNLSSVSCSVNGVSCSESVINSGDYLSLGFSLINALHTGKASVRADFSTLTGVNLGSESVSSNFIIYSFNLPAGSQGVLARVTDLIDGDIAEELILSVIVNGSESTILTPTDYPFHEQGSEFEAVVDFDFVGFVNGLSLSEGMLVSVTVAGIVYYFIKKNGVITRVNKYYFDYYSKQDSLSEREEWYDSIFDALEMPVDFIKGFLFGTHEGGSYAETAGDFVGGLCVYGDLRDVALYAMSKFGLVKDDYDEVFLGFALFGVVTEVVDVGDAFVTGFKTAWKRVPKPVKEAWTVFFKQSSDFFKGGGKVDELGKLLSNLVSKIRLDKIELFLKSTANFIGKTPLSKLGHVADLFAKLVKYGDDLTAKIFRRIIGVDDVIKISKYLDDIGEESFGRIHRLVDEDNFFKLTDNVDELTGLMTCVGKLSDNSIESLRLTLKSVSVKDVNYDFVKRLISNLDDDSVKAGNDLIKSLDKLDLKVVISDSIDYFDVDDIKFFDEFISSSRQARDEAWWFVSNNGLDSSWIKQFDEIRIVDDMDHFALSDDLSIAVNFNHIGSDLNLNDARVIAFEEVFHKLAPPGSDVFEDIFDLMDIDPNIHPDLIKNLLNEGHDFFTMSLMKRVNGLDFNDVSASFTKQTLSIFDEFVNLVNKEILSGDDLDLLGKLLNKYDKGSFLAKNLALNEDNIKYLDILRKNILSMDISKELKLSLINKSNDLLKLKDDFIYIMENMKI